MTLSASSWMANSAAGWAERTQKKLVRADATVSRPANRKLTIMSHQGRDGHGSFSRNLRSEVESDGEIRDGERQLQAHGIQPEREFTDTIESESSEHVLQIQNAVIFSGDRREKRYETALNLMAHDLETVRSYRLLAELQDRHFLLKPPRISVHVEYPQPQKVPKNGGERFPLRVVLESGLQNILHVLRVRRNGVPQNMNIDCLRRRPPEKMSVPVTEVAEILRPTGRQISMANLAVAQKLWLREQQQQQGR